MVEPKIKKPLASLGQSNPLKEVNNSLVFKQRPGSNSSKKLPSRGEMRELERSDGFSVAPLGMNLLNLSQDEGTFASTVKIDLMQIQDDINKLDYDGKIRSSLQNADFSYDKSDFTFFHELIKLPLFFLKIFCFPYSKSHISSVKKWLSNISDLSGNFKDLLDNRMNEAAEGERILESMRVSSYSDAFKKLYKMVGKEAYLDWALI